MTGGALEAFCGVGGSGGSCELITIHVMRIAPAIRATVK